MLPSKFHFDIKAPDHSILSGNVIDYALLHNTLASTTALTSDWAVPWRPHALLTLQLNIEAATKEYREVQYFPPLPATPDIDFRPWTSYQSQAFEIELYGIPPNGQAQKWADWISCTEQYLLQEHPWAAQGRGASLRVIIKPLVSTKITTTWKKGKPAFWEQLQVRFQLAVKQPTEQLAALEQAWETTYYQLQTKQYPWYTVRGPMAAAITYLKEWGWQAANLMRWTRPEAPLLLSNELDMHQPWWKVEKALLHEAKNQRTNRLASRQHHHNLIAGPPKANATSTLGFRQQCNFVKPPRSKDVRCAKSMPHQSTSCGYANGTKLRNMSLCRQSGWTGSHPKRKNLYGPPAGFPWNRKSIDNKTIHTRAMAVGQTLQQ